MKIRSHTWLAISLVFTLAACKGSDGATGPQGEQGPAGNANVVTRVFTAAAITWTNQVQFGTNYKVASLTVPEITADVISNGAVLVYGGFFFGGSWTALPVSYPESGITRSFFYTIGTGNTTLRYAYDNNAVPATPSIQFKVVVIPRAVLAQMLTVGVGLNDEAAVMKYLKLSN